MSYADPFNLTLWFRRHRAAWKAAGLCTRCGNERTDVKLTCRRCRLRQNDYRQRLARKAA